MADGHDWVVKKHSRAGKAHDFPDFLPHVRLIAVHFAVGAEGFRLHEGAAVAAAAGIGIQGGAVRASSREDHDIPVFAMTANTFVNDRCSCREAGMTDYIAKPVSVKDIENALTEIED